MNQKQNLVRIKSVYHALEELAKDVVFTGGATVALYAERPYIDSRPTDDVDILVELLYHKEYAILENKLRQKGFANDTESGVLCRFKIQGIIVDVIPTSDAVLGFSNRWYPQAFGDAKQIMIDETVSVKIFGAAYFLATKLEAFKSRGRNDGRTSTDFEDIVFLLNKRNSIWTELEESSIELKTYLKESLSNLLHEKYIDEWISCHLDFGEQSRINFILHSMEEFV